MFVILIAAIVWSGVHNAPDNAPTRVDNGYLVQNR